MYNIYVYIYVYDMYMTHCMLRHCIIATWASTCQHILASKSLHLLVSFSQNSGPGFSALGILLLFSVYGEISSSLKNHF